VYQINLSGDWGEQNPLTKTILPAYSRLLKIAKFILILTPGWDAGSSSISSIFQLGFPWQTIRQLSRDMTIAELFQVDELMNSRAYQLQLG